MQKSLFWTFVFCTFFCCIGSNCSPLTLLHNNDSVLEDKCVVIFPSNEHPLSRILQKAFSRDEGVSVVAHDDVALSLPNVDCYRQHFLSDGFEAPDVNEDNANFCSGLSFAVVPSTKETFECLNPIARADGRLQTRWTIAFFASTELPPTEALQTVNDQCESRRRLDGSLDEEGEAAERLENMYRNASRQLFRKAVLRSSLERKMRFGHDNAAGLLPSFYKNDGEGDFQPRIRCPRLSEPPKSPQQFLRDFVGRGQPAIFDGAAKEWPAMRKWTTAWLKKHAGNRIVHVKIAPQGIFEGPEDLEEWKKSCRIITTSEESKLCAENALHRCVRLDEGKTLFCTRQLSSQERGSLSVPPFVAKGLSHESIVTARAATAELQLSKLLDSLKTNVSRGPTKGSKNTTRKLERKDYYSERATASFYLEYSSLEVSLGPYLAQDTSIPAFAGEYLQLAHKNVWIGGGETRGKLHFDPYENLMGVISGKKTFIIIDPFASKELREGHLREGNLRFVPAKEASADYQGVFVRDLRGLQEATSRVMSPLDLQYPNSTDFPSFETVAARAWECEVKKGDILYLPAFWWHEVVSSPGEEGVTTAVNYWFEPFFSKPFPCPDCPLRAPKTQIAVEAARDQKKYRWKYEIH